MLAIMTDPWTDLHDVVDDCMSDGTYGGTADMSVDDVFDHQKLVTQVQHLRADLYYLRKNGDSYLDNDGGRLDDAYATALGLAADVFVVVDRLAERRNQAGHVTA